MDINSFCWGSQIFKKLVSKAPSLSGVFYQIKQKYIRKKCFFQPVISEMLLFKRMALKKKMNQFKVHWKETIV